MSMNTDLLSYTNLCIDDFSIPKNNTNFIISGSISNQFDAYDKYIDMHQIYFQERVKDLYIFCIYKEDNIFKIGLFEISENYKQILKTYNLLEIIEILKSDLSDEEFREYERRIFKYF